MSMTYQSWTWRDNATEDQMESVCNKAAVERLAAEARSLYDSLYDPRDEYQVERFHDQIDNMETDAEREEALRLHSVAQQEIRGQIDAITDMLYLRGARFARDYEHWNEDEQRIEYEETRYDNEPDY